MFYPADVRPHIENYDEWNIQNLIVWGENMMPSDWPHDRDIVARMQKRRLCNPFRHALAHRPLRRRPLPFYKMVVFSYYSVAYVLSPLKLSRANLPEEKVYSNYSETGRTEYP